MDDELDAIAKLRVRLSEVKFQFSAKGAVFISSLGQRPRDLFNAGLSALKARFIRAPIRIRLTQNRCTESRFQRLSVVPTKPWGAAPGSHESALTAL